MKVIRFAHAGALILFLVIQSSGLALSQTIDRQAAARAALADYFQKAAGLGFSGAVLVSLSDKLLLREGYGWADVKRRVPVTPDTIFDIGSGVKAFTATAVLQLEEQGRLNTSDPIAKHLRGVPADKADLTI